MKLTRVTITGADDGVNPYDLCRLYDEFPFVEWGILLSEKREGSDRRYPSRDWIDLLLRRTSTVVPLAGHLCGQWCRDAIDGPFLWAIQRWDHFQRFHRVQFNGAAYAEETKSRVLKYGRAFPGKDFILPVKSFDGGHIVAGQFSPCLLLDRSGGRGIELTDFPAPPPGVCCGYAGGFGPDNLRAVLEKLTAIPGDAHFWIDMESHVRTDRGGFSVFDLDKVRRCLEIAEPFVVPSRKRPAA